ncbi:Signal transduction histidine kinase [Sphingopyxis sp. YR583]|uniref:sensor histidine kinase n=1 Tax=Sphingopyxis sp. YR583 TaxID=1881047 RepID=UPI0008A7A44B|nr:sensor histidine kinase [Sphingopyxis sp. YR583]SEH13938.1 Signal transduction histidine kinase [Sphingopyxis sp. YR583]
MRILYAVLGILFLLGAQPAWAQLEKLPRLDLRGGEDAPALGSFVRFAERPGAARTPQLDAILAGPLQRIKGSTIHFGPPGTRTVVLLKVRNASDQQGSWILTTGRGSLKHFRLYETAGGPLTLIVDGTDPQVARENLGTYQAFSSELVLAPSQEKLIAIEFVSENSTYMPLKIETYGTFFKERRANISMVSGVVIGALTLLLLNFLFFSITGFREFLWLAVAEAFFALNTVHSEGYITIFFLYDKPLTGVAVEDFFKCGFAAAMAQFCRSFVKTADNFPKRDLILKALVLFAIAVMLLQPGLSLYPPELRFYLHLAAWIVAVAVALFLPFVGYAAMRQLGFQLWPLFVGWASLAVFIVYAAVASMGVFTWLPINWHLSGPVGLFESVMVTLALGLNLKKIQQDKLVADANYAHSLTERLAISERATRLAEEKASALETVNSQNALLHSSGHDSRQVILALNSAVDVLKRQDRAGADIALIEMLESSADYLNEIVSTTISGANIAANDADFVALSAFRGQALVEPLSMMFKTPFANKRLKLDVRIADDVTIISDRPLLMRALANLLSNSYQYTQVGGARIALALEKGQAVITISDSGSGMPAEVATALNGGAVTRIRADDTAPGTGSGYGSAKRIIERLRGKIKIISSTPEGTEICITLPAAFAATSSIEIDELQARLHGWALLDFDQRGDFEARLAAAGSVKERSIALTYDDTTVTRGRLSDLVAMVLIKPACREFLEHPLLAEPSK